MTLILALECADGLLLACDGQQTIATGGQPVKSEAKKIRAQFHNVAWGGSGAVGVIQHVEQALATGFPHATAFANKKKYETRVAICSAVRDAVRPILQSAVSGSGEPAPFTSFLFVGQAVDGPFIFEVHANLTDSDHLATGYAAIGSGDIFPYVAMAGLAHFGIRKRTIDEASLIAHRILSDAIAVAATGIGPPIQMIRIVKDEAGKGRCAVLTEDDVRALQDKVAEWKVVENEALSKFVGLPDMAEREETPAPEEPEADAEPNGS